jgi:hypothetical protein
VSSTGTGEDAHCFVGGQLGGLDVQEERERRPFMASRAADDPPPQP